MSCIIDSNRNLIDSSMVPLGHFTPFAGKIVAYRQAPYCSHHEISFHLEDSRVWFARICEYNSENSEEPRHEMEPVWAHQTMDESDCEVSATKLGLTILLRLATREELDLISQAIDEDRAFVHYNSKILSQGIIRNAIDELPLKGTDENNNSCNIS